MTQDNVVKACLVVALGLLVAAMLGMCSTASAQVINTGEVVQDTYTFLPMVSGEQVVIDDLHCKVTEQYPDGSWVETCYQALGNNRWLVCTVHYAADWRILYKGCVIMY